MVSLLVKSSLAGMLALSLAAPGSALAQEGPDTLQETYRDWVVRCETLQDGDDAPASRVCEVAQELSDTGSGQRVLTMGFQVAPDGAAALTMVTPFGLRLSEGVRILVAERPLAEVGFRTCLPRGCIASGVLNPDAIEALSANQDASVVMVGDGGQVLTLTVSLAGFTAAWTRLGGLSGE